MEVFCSNCLTSNEDTNLNCINCGYPLNYNLGKERVKRADFWIRFMAFLIDAFLIVFIWVITSFLMVKIFPFLVFNFEETTLKLIFSVVVIMLMLMYNILMENTKKQATIGKQLLKLTVGDITGKRLSLDIIIIRNVSKIITCLTLGIGYIIIIFHHEKQSLHDIIANSYVFREI